jgi:PIN like domain
MAGEAAASGLRFFLDRGLGAIVVPSALRAAGWTLETMDERYGAHQSQNIQDTQWIEEATLADDVLLCKDLAIAQNPLEAQVVYMTSARVFGLSNAAISGPTMAQWYLSNEARIIKTALKATGPYVMAVNPSYGLRRAKLAYPAG